MPGSAIGQRLMISNE